MTEATGRRLPVLLAPLFIAVAAIAAVLVLTTTAASGQNNDATIDLTVRWPDGSLGPSDVCAAYFTRFDDGDFGFFASTLGSTASLPVSSGGQIAIQVGGTCSAGDNTRVEPLTWNRGIPALGPSIGVENLLTIEPGPNPITIPIGTATFRGTVTGVPLPASCLITATGQSDISEVDPRATFSVRANDDGSWELPVHPGEYTVFTQCNLRGGFEVWPDSDSYEDSQTVALTNMQARTLNFDMGDRFDDDTGQSFMFRGPANEGVSVCAEIYDEDSRLIQRSGESLNDVNNGGNAAFGVRVSVNGDFRIRLADCDDQGFTEQWYPEGATLTGGPAFEVDGSIVEATVDLRPLEFPGRLPEPAPESAGTCNGMPITVDLSAGDRPTNGDDVILGTDGDDVINAGDGRDVICGRGGNDTINAGNGADTILGGDGDDTIQAGQGKDVVFAQDGDDFVSGGKGKDTLAGGEGNDDLRGNEGTDTIDGGAGNDELRGGQKADTVTGGSGDDTLIGGTRPDVMDGGSGLDSYNGGGGADTCAVDPSGLAEVRLRCELF